MFCGILEKIILIVYEIIHCN